MQSVMTKLLFTIVNVIKKWEQPRSIHLLHFQHKGGRVGFKIIIYTDSGENLIGDTERGILSRDKRAWNYNAKVSLKYDVK